MLGNLKIPVGKLAPEEFIYLASGFAVLVCGKQPVHIADELIHSGLYPAVSQCPLGRCIRTRRCIGDRADHEPAGVPDLVDEIAVGFHFLDAEVHVIPGCGTHQQGESQGIRSHLIHHSEWVDDIALGLAHFRAVFIADEAVQVDSMEWRFTGKFDAIHDHAGDPEE